MVKSRINITIGSELLQKLDDYRREYGYTRSFVIFLALRNYFQSINEEGKT